MSIHTSDEGTSYCLQCEQHAKDLGLFQEMKGLPKWIENHYNYDGKDKQFLESIRIAWEVLERISKTKGYSDDTFDRYRKLCRDAMIRIRKFGKSE
jgi:hypothetical protein